MPDKFPQVANAKVGGPMHPTHPPWLALWGIVALQTLAHSIGGLGQALDATYCGLLLKWMGFKLISIERLDSNS